MRAAETTGARRVVLQAIGPVAKLVERKVGTYKNGRDLTAYTRNYRSYVFLIVLILFLGISPLFKIGALAFFV